MHSTRVPRTSQNHVSGQLASCEKFACNLTTGG
jgi:hypothetical protein